MRAIEANVICKSRVLTFGANWPDLMDKSHYSIAHIISFYVCRTCIFDVNIMKTGDDAVNDVLRLFRQVKLEAKNDDAILIENLCVNYSPRGIAPDRLHLNVVVGHSRSEISPESWRWEREGSGHGEFVEGGRWRVA